MEKSMCGKWTFRIFATQLLLLGWLGGAADGAAPWNNLIDFKKVEADPKKSYTLTEEHGPWMITAASFSGKGAEDQAKELVGELRKRYKLEAYVYKVKFDFQDTQARGLDQFGAPLKMVPKRGKELEEYAVMVGNFSSVEDSDAQKALQTVKYAQPDCLDVNKDKKTNQSLAGWRMIQKEVQAAVGSEQKKKGPMGHAFITANPLLPKEYFAPEGLDEFVIKMNKGVEHSLLDCPGKYTVLVATFKGHDVIKQNEIKAIESGKKFDSSLAEAGYKAHMLTNALRIKGYEAYEFHDRCASIVTVGSFTSVGSPRSDGKIEINPQINIIMQTFKAKPVAANGGAMKPQKMGPFEDVGDIFFDIQPMPVEVPKRTVSAALAKGNATLR
jgi:hypothetical protein